MSETRSPKVFAASEHEIEFAHDLEDNEYYMSVRYTDARSRENRVVLVKMTPDQMNDVINASQNLYYGAPPAEVPTEKYEDIKLKELVKEAIREFMWESNQRALMAWNNQHHIIQPPIPFPFIGTGPHGGR